VRPSAARSPGRDPRLVQLTGAAALGAAGLDWQLGWFAADPPTASTPSMGDSNQVGQLVQAMAGFASDSGGAGEGLNTTPLSAHTLCVADRCAAQTGRRGIEVIGTIDVSKRQAAALFLIAPMIAVSMAPPAPPAITCEMIPSTLRLPDCAAAVIAGSKRVTI
jgi:hypothetical protein